MYGIFRNQWPTGLPVACSLQHRCSFRMNVCAWTAIVTWPISSTRGAPIIHSLSWDLCQLDVHPWEISLLEGDRSSLNGGVQRVACPNGSLNWQSLERNPEFNVINSSQIRLFLVCSHDISNYGRVNYMPNHWMDVKLQFLSSRIISSWNLQTHKLKVGIE